MPLEIVDGYPPNFSDIVEAFPDARRMGVIFTFGLTLYAPGYSRRAFEIPSWLMAHEEVHSRRQLSNPEPNALYAWWWRYIEDKVFRFDEELVAHIEEWRIVKRDVPLRQHRRRLLHEIATRLSSPLYGNVVPYKTARELIVEGAKSE